MALELGNHCSSHVVSPDVWDGVRDLMRRVGWNRERQVATIKELKIQ